MRAGVLAAAAALALVTPAVAGLAPQPDLTGRWQSVAQSCHDGRCTLTGTFVALNEGQADAGPFVTRFYLSTDYTLDAGDTLLQERATTSLRAARATNLSLSARIGASAGGKVVIAVVDAARAVIESDELNNRVGTTISAVR